MTTLRAAGRSAPAILVSIASFACAVSARLIRRKTLADLEALDDHLLRDVGLTRFDIREMRRHW